jgi:hypothetical protein
MAREKDKLVQTKGNGGVYGFFSVTNDELL